jgi:hypothetical protein
MVQIPEVKVGQEVPIHHQEVVRQILHQLDGRHGTQESRFFGILDVDSPPGPATEIRLNQGRHVVHAQDEIGNLLFVQAADQYLQHGSIPHRHKGFGYDAGKGFQPCPLSSCENDGLHMNLLPAVS